MFTNPPVPVTVRAVALMLATLALMADIGPSRAVDCATARQQFKAQQDECFYQGNRLDIHLTNQQKAFVNWCKNIQQYIKRCDAQPQVEEQGYMHLGGSTYSFQRGRTADGRPAYTLQTTGRYGPIVIRAERFESYPVSIPCTQGKGFHYLYSEHIPDERGQPVLARQGSLYIQPHTVGSGQGFRGILTTEMYAGRPINLSHMNPCQHGGGQLVEFVPQ